MRVPSPRHGWRVFAGEVGIIVLGVLLALGAQQVAEEYAMRGRIAEFRKAVHAEMAGNLWYHQMRRDRMVCELKQLDAFMQWLRATRPGQTVQVANPPRSYFWTSDSSVWQNRDPQVFAELPVRERLLLAQFYDTIGLVETMSGRLRERGHLLRELELPSTLDDDARRHLYGAASAMRDTTKGQVTNIDTLFDLARELNVAKHPPVFVEASEDRDVQREVKVCLPFEDRSPR